MLFNSIAFLIFLPIVFSLYWFALKKNLKLQNILLIIASYIFYGWWDWRFLILLVASSCTDFFLGLAIGKQEDAKKRKRLLILSLIINLGILGFFKYFNFFVDSFISSFASLGVHLDSRTLNIILPVGISFYTFQSLSYTIDIYRRQLEARKNLLNYLAFVSFFPQLVAGPIERARNLLPQFEKARVFTYENGADGLKLMLWGFFKKVVVADNCGVWANSIFNNSENISGPTLLLGAVFFTFQIYGDFSGYSDIARGLAKLFGFELMKNFNLPYFSRSMREFWQRWHISLSTWFKDYVYIPLGGSRCSKLRQILNTLITFTLSGFWHGANWTFIIWGFLNGLFMIPGIIFNRPVAKDLPSPGKILPSIKDSIAMIVTFFLAVIAWIFFRSQDLSQAFSIIGKMFSAEPLKTNYLRPEVLLAIAMLLIIEWLQREKDHPLKIDSKHIAVRWLIYLFVLLAILYLGNYTSPLQFIYFQF
jgi:D-alanyl-lipoteichoic acid acyltransferase DltB (MBOAT superfamily)